MPCSCLQLGPSPSHPQLTYGLTEKEIDRKGGIDKLVYNDSVKGKVKDYIRQYMKKHGPVYKRS